MNFWTKKAARALAILAFIALASAAKSQSAPATFPYQAIVRDAAGKPLDEQSVGLLIEIKKGATAIYSEDHDLVTSPFGLISVAVGEQKASDFAQIDWENGPFSLRAVFSGAVSLETESPFQAVPFAFLASEVLTEKQTLALVGDQLSISGGNSVNLPTTAVNPWQTVSGGIAYTGGGVGIGSTDLSGGIGLSIQKNVAVRDETGAPRLTTFAAPNGGFYLGVGSSQTTFQSVMASQPLGASSYISTGSDGAGYFQAQAFPSGTYVDLVDPLQKKRVQLGQENGTAWVGTNSANGKAGAELLSKADGYNEMHVHDENETLRILAQVPFGPTEPEGLKFYSHKGTLRSQITAYGNDPKNGGAFMTFDTLGNEKATFFSGVNSEGHLALFAAESAPGNYKIGAEMAARNASGGSFFRLYNASNEIATSMYVDPQGKGNIEATGMKNFVEPHPTDEKKEIVFASLEGPEAAVYLRGTARLEKGRAEIEFPEAFKLVLASPETMTVQLTPRSEKSRGLAAVERSATGFRVRELGRRTRSYDFDWEVKAVRRGFENFQPIRSKTEKL